MVNSNNFNKVAVALIINKKNEFLIQKKTLDYKGWPGGPWALFGGRIEKGEASEQGLKRELIEELGLNFKDYKLFKVIDYPSIKEKFYIYILPFNHELSDIKLREGAGFSFFSIEELRKINLLKINLEIIEEYVKSLK